MAKYNVDFDLKREYFATVVTNAGSRYITTFFHIVAPSLSAALVIAEKWCADNYKDCRVADISEEV